MLKAVIGVIWPRTRRRSSTRSARTAKSSTWLFIFAETGLLVGFFLPGDSLLFTAGVLAGQSGPGQLRLWLLLPGVFVAAFLGSELGYFIGRWVGPPLFRRPDSRLFKQEYVERTHAFFERHGPKAVVLARFVPVVRTFTPVMAGVGEMNRRLYTLYNVVGALLWAVGVTMLGYILGNAIGGSIDNYLLPLIAVIIGISLLPTYFEWRRARHAAPSPAPPDGGSRPAPGRASTTRPEPGRVWAGYSPADAPSGWPSAASAAAISSDSAANAPPLRFEKAIAARSTTSATPAIAKRAASLFRRLMIAGQDQQRHQVHDLDERVQRRSRGVLERVTDRVADHGRFVRFGALPAEMAVLDVLLGVVPRATGVR